VTRSLILSRKDRKKDRVEVGYQDLALASTIAEKFSSLDGVQQTVVGWYHSHPHITAMPSHVDVRTQGHYQQLDVGFIGLIFSVFDRGRLEICAFQSRGSGSNVGDCQWATVEIPILISRESMSPTPGPLSLEAPISSENNVALLAVLLNEDKQIFHSLSGSAFSPSPHDPTNASQSDLTRAFNVYQSSLLHLVDLQLAPTLAALRSRRLTLERERDLLKQQLNSRSILPKPSEMPRLTPLNICTRLSVLESLTPLWAHSSQSLRLAFDGVLVSIVSLPSSWSGLPTSTPHFLRIIPTPADKRHICPTRLSLWSLLLDNDPLLSAPILALNSVRSDLSCDCQWEVATSGRGDSQISIFAFDLSEKAPHLSVLDQRDASEEQKGSLAPADLFRTVLQRSLYMAH
jgi:BRCA1/BRCA2-containing complex subunit 3